MAFFDSLINTIRRGMIIGKLKMAIKVKLLPAFEAMAETIVNKEENPKLPIKRVIKKSGKS